jgi:hypothetical protein
MDAWKQGLRVERLPNGLFRVWDSVCQWDAIYSYHADRSCMNIQWEHGAVDTVRYRIAVALFVSQPSGTRGVQ